MKFFRKDSFNKDIIILLLVGMIFSACFAAGFATATDKYFGKAISGLMGDFGEYDLLFQGRQELKDALARQIKEAIAEHLPGATFKPGISLAGTATFFVTLPPQYKTKEVYNNLGYYFKNLPGSGGFSIMTEPKLHIKSIPTAIFDLLSKEVERIPGVAFTFRDGNNIGVIMKNSRVASGVEEKINAILAKYQILEVRLETQTASSEELIGLGKKVSQSVIGIEGVDYAKDVTMSSGNDDQYLLNTLVGVKQFLLAYAAEVKIIPAADVTLQVGDLLVLDGQNEKALKPGAMLEPLNVVVKVTAVDDSKIDGLIIQGDAEYLKNNVAYKLLSADKVGPKAGTVEVSSRKSQLVYALNQGVNLLTKLDTAVEDFNNTNSGAGITVNSIEKAYQEIITVQKALSTVEASIDGLSGKANHESLSNMASLIEGVGDDLDYLARTFGRIQLLESNFNKALTGLDTAKLLLGSPMLHNSLSGTGGIYDKYVFLNEQLNTVEESLRARVQQLDDFINHFNPLVSVLLSWRNKAQDFAGQVNTFGTLFTPGSENHARLKELIQSTDEVLTGITGIDLAEATTGLNLITDQLFGSGELDLSALIGELERFRDALPKLLDEEIGNSVNLIDKYVGGESTPQDKVQIFTKAGVDRAMVDAAIKDAVGNRQVGIFSLPAGTIQPDIRGELYKILAEVRSTIAALVVIVLWILSFILDHSLIISMMKKMGFSLLPESVEFTQEWLNRIYHSLRKLMSMANLYAFGVGGLWLGVAFFLAGGAIPYLDYWQIGIIGGICGIFIAILAEKINPVDKDEVLAGLSLGLPFKTIMREIVIPSGRPGLLQILNRWKMVLK